jgi:hypothetical protein
MSRPAGPVAVVVARTDPTPTTGASLARFADEVGPIGQAVLVDSSGQDLPGLDPRVRVIRRPPGRLAPELWRDGLLATDSPLVAFSTAQMIPCRGWLTAMTDRLRSAGSAGVGGPIEPGKDLSATDRAVALLRYSGYFPPLPGPSRVDPPGDNALYRRDRLMEVESSWADGFWEVEVHRALRDRGANLSMADSAVVTFGGGVDLSTMIRHRWAHARRYGAGRSMGLGTMARLARLAAFPMVPPLLFGRIMAAIRARGMALGPWLPALPGLAIMTSAWAMGEAVGTWHGDGIASGLSPIGSTPRTVTLASPSNDVSRTGTYRSAIDNVNP